jgi:hypothetical protein
MSSTEIRQPGGIISADGRRDLPAIEKIERFGFVLPK